MIWCFCQHRWEKRSENGAAKSRTVFDEISFPLEGVFENFSKVVDDTITFSSHFGGTTATKTDGIYTETGSLSIGLECAFPMS